ncbi:hypothetical protein ACFSKI_17040 [Pseudogracilibacillus auburnensis]|uniref:Uncharacterized protein n=1 Tax=Pseudogracilibacillus auburnensis TaxID=1494959 RepID=A0A2V3WAZ5_9BACI|nr:hypothetical protein [Pseudogracilibacillus auburnensis]MBO1003634.1 hypothetical protein [Pseudogracilibacillus auburnensis]PXW89325.1 hypothetical protein DFR56_102101 [Pseudogracilibacillus auburnensis]
MYQFREVVLKNGFQERKVLAIDFDDPKLAIVSEFLMADANLLGGKIIEEIDQVLLGEEEYIESSGNRCVLKIKADETMITDLFEDMEDVNSLDSYHIDTKELRELILMWLEKLEEFRKENW